MARLRTRQSADTPGGPALKRALTTPLLYFFILGDVLGAGVYVLVGQVAADAGGAVWVPLAVALLLAMLTAASYAELATKYPRAGGASHYATRAFGPFAGFVAGFCMLAAGIVSVAALARGFGGDYLSEFVTLPVGLVAVLFLALLALVNARGIKESTRANVVATVVEVGGLLVVVALGVRLMVRGDGDLGRLGQLGTPEKGAAAAVLSGSVLAYYSFVGFETSVNVAEETRDPRRSYPRPCSAPSPPRAPSTCWWASRRPSPCRRPRWPGRAGRSWRSSRRRAACRPGCSARSPSSPSRTVPCSPGSWPPA